MLQVALIDKSYFFKQPFLIQNIEGNSMVYEANTQALEDNILTYSEEYLYYLLGDDLADLFINAINTDVTNLEQRFQDLLAQIVDSENISSALQGYIIFHHRREQLVLSSNAGETKPTSENGDSTIDYSKLQIAMKNCRKKTEKIVEYLSDNIETFPEWQFIDFSFVEFNALGI